MEKIIDDKMQDKNFEEQKLKKLEALLMVQRLIAITLHYNKKEKNANQKSKNIRIYSNSQAR